MNALTRLASQQQRLDAGVLDEVTAEIEAARDLMAEESPLRDEMISALGLIQVLRSSMGADGFSLDAARANLPGFRAGIDAIASPLPDARETGILYWREAAGAGLVCIGEAFVARDPQRFDQGLTLLRKAYAAPGLSVSERLSVLIPLGHGFRMRYELARHRRDLNNAIDRLEEARRIMDELPDADGATALHLLADCYHARGDDTLRDRWRAVSAGLDGLRERAEEVRLQTGARRGLETAASAEGEATTVARWCLAAGQNEAAVAALELGRGMVLHVATSDAGIPGLLREHGEHDLATEWEESTRDGPAPWDLPATTRTMRGAAESLGNLAKPALPSDLRRRVLRALDEAGAAGGLGEPPPVGDIAAALRERDIAALVYLLPQEDYGLGCALVVRSDATVEPVSLPDLRTQSGSRVAEFDEAQREVSRHEEGSQEYARGQLHRKRVLDELCGWAWQAAMNRVLHAAGSGSPRRRASLVLVPVGGLGVVPWHAARRIVAGGELRYACQDAVIVYAASARQFVDASRREHRPWQSAPGIVRVAESGLYWASREIEEIRTRYYPNATYLGGSTRRSATASPPATPSNVLTLLPGPDSPGASVLHLGCHAHPADPPTDSFLALSGRHDNRLQVQHMLEQARHRPTGAAGGLVVLAACASDRTGRTYDEALTLATAFLAAGASGVVGARWAVDDIPTAAFMIMFHHYLNSGYGDPATALRATQLWMLNPRRRLPAGIARQLATELSRVDLTETGHWAAFTYQGR